MPTVKKFCSCSKAQGKIKAGIVCQKLNLQHRWTPSHLSKKLRREGKRIEYIVRQKIRIFRWNLRAGYRKFTRCKPVGLYYGDRISTDDLSSTFSPSSDSSPLESNSFCYHLFAALKFITTGVQLPFIIIIIIILFLPCFCCPCPPTEHPHEAPKSHSPCRCGQSAKKYFGILNNL